MDSFLELLGAGASVASGGIFGVAGSLIGAWFKKTERDADRAWQAKKWDYEERMMDKQIQVGQAETENEIAIAGAVGSWQGLNTSIQADSVGSKGCSIWATNIKTLFRPFLTLTLWVLAAWVFGEMMAAMVTENHPLAKLFSVEEMKEILKYMVYTVFFCASTATMWWYGERSLSPPATKHR